MLDLILALSLSAAAISDPIELPVSVCKGYWFVPVTYESRTGGNAHVIEFLHDTGAGASFIDPDALEAMSGRRFEEGARVTLTDGRVGRVTLNRLPARVQELDHLSTAMGRPVDAILSVNAFEDFLQIIDYEAQTLTLQTGSLPRPDGDTVFSSRGEDARPWVSVVMGGRLRSLLIDTGAPDVSFAVNHIDRFDLDRPARPLTGATRLTRLETRAMSRLDAPVTLAGVTFEAPVLEEVPEAELLGGQILRHYRITLDQRRRRVQLDPYAPGAVIAAEDHYEFGAVFDPDGASLLVRAVFEDTPAARAGLQEGDLVERINDRPVAERGCDEGPDGAPVLFTIRRGEERLELVLDAQPVLPVTPEH